MKEQRERLIQFSDQKLIDIVKNYRQYGYDEALRETALSILEERGIDLEQLKLSGNFENNTYELAQNLYAAFTRNSTIAMVLYGLLIAFRLIISNLSAVGVIPVLILFWASLIAYLVFFLQSFNNQRNFYKAIGKEAEAESGIVYFLLGMPFFILLYPYFKNKMKEQMQIIR